MIEKISFEERQDIQKYIKQGKSGGEIAMILARSRNGINTEIRNAGGREAYDAVHAQHRSDSVRQIQNEQVSKKLRGHKDSFGWKIRIEALESALISLSLDNEKLKKTINEMIRNQGGNQFV